MKKRIGLLVLAASLMVSQTALAGQWTGAVPTQTRADWAAEYDTPTVGPAATRGTADLLDQPNGNALMTYYPKRARAGPGCGGEIGCECGWAMRTAAA